MIRGLAIIALMTGAIPAIAQDNNPFSGATSISVEMTRHVSINSPIPDGRKNRRHPFRLRCTLDGRPINWKERARQYRVRLAGETVDIPPDAAGPMMVLLWAGGARCR